MAEEGQKVKLNIYDLSQGLARQLSVAFLGKSIEAIWHTGIVVYGNEYYFGAGIQHDPVGRTPYGVPLRSVELGVTHVPKEIFEDYLEEISSRYTAETYRLLSHNCNNFSNEVAQFLVGTSIPDYILQLPNEVMNSPMAPLFLPMIQQLETTMRSGAVPQAPQFVPPTQKAQQHAAPRVAAPIPNPEQTGAVAKATAKKNLLMRRTNLRVQTLSAKPGAGFKKKSQGSLLQSWQPELCVLARLQPLPLEGLWRGMAMRMPLCSRVNAG